MEFLCNITGRQTSILYLVGVPDPEELQINPSLQTEILKESDTYKDLAITDNVVMAESARFSTHTLGALQVLERGRSAHGRICFV